MEVILLKDVDKVGLRGDVVNVARGYARNFLLPRKLAEPATDALVAELKKRDERRARSEAATVEQANQVADVLRAAELSFDVKAGPTGALFGSVTTTDIADQIWEKHKIRVDRRKIDTDSIRRIGRYAIPIQLFEGVTRRGADARHPRGRRAAARGGARRDGGRRGRGAGRRAGRSRGAPRRGGGRARGDARGRGRGRARAAADPGGGGHGGRRARRPRRPRPRPSPRRLPSPRTSKPESVLAQHAPQACGACCELPALSGHGCCGQARILSTATVENCPNGRSFCLQFAASASHSRL